jgi:hypothetical protein
MEFLQKTQRCKEPENTGKFLKRGNNQPIVTKNSYSKTQLLLTKTQEFN